MRASQFAKLTAFVAVAEHTSFTRAATQLGISNPSLSHAIRSLEDQLGVRLLNRTTRNVALTEAGAELLAHLNPALERFEKALDVVNGFRAKLGGTLRVAVHPVAAGTIVPSLIARFSAQNPDIRLEIYVDRERGDIVGNRFDAGIQVDGGVAQDMIAVPIGGQFRFLTVVAPGYLAGKAPPSHPGDLKQHKCIEYFGTGRNADLRWRFRKGENQVELEVRGSLAVNDADLALRAALEGIGIVQLPELVVAPYIAEGRLVSVVADWCSQSTEFVLFYPGRRLVPLKLRALIDFFRHESKKALRVKPDDSVRDSACIETIQHLKPSQGQAHASTVAMVA
jgi:DNA-binding transcriptional LysR family regulator